MDLRRADTGSNLQGLTSLANCKNPAAINCVGDLAHRGLLMIVSKWEEIAVHFDELLTGKNGPEPRQPVDK